jgi:hypothetical protein
MGKLDDIAARAAGRKRPTGAPKATPAVSRRNPLNLLPVTGDIETDDKAEAAAVLDTLRQTDEVVRKVTGNGYWLTLVFVSEDQRNEFVRKAGWGQFADADDTYYDGLGIAAHLSVKLIPEKLPFRGEQADATLVREVGIMPPGE